METKLKTYIKERKITITELAKTLGVSRVHLTNICNGAPAGKRLALLIENWSNGEIKHTDILYPEHKYHLLNDSRAIL